MTYSLSVETTTLADAMFWKQNLLCDGEIVEDNDLFIVVEKGGVLDYEPEDIKTALEYCHDVEKKFEQLSKTHQDGWSYFEIPEYDFEPFGVTDIHQSDFV